jgi:hypothetical protein
LPRDGFTGGGCGVLLGRKGEWALMGERELRGWTTSALYHSFRAFCVGGRLKGGEEGSWAERGFVRG